MGKFKKPKRKLGKFLKNTEFAHNRKELIKLGSGIASGALLFNVIFAGTSLAAHTNTPHNSIAAEDEVIELGKEVVPGYPKCWRMVPIHASVAHANTAHNSVTTY